MMLSEPSRGWDNKTCENLTCNSFTFLASITASIHSCFQVILTCLLSIFTLLWEELVASMLQHDPLDILFSFIFISWRLITLQYCSGFCHTLTWISHGVACVPHSDPLSPFPPHPIPLSSQCTSPEHLSHASNLGWWSVSPLRVYLFQWYSFRTSNPCLLPQSPKVCSVHLCLFFCFAYRVIITIV